MMVNQKQDILLILSFLTQLKTIVKGKVFFNQRSAENYYWERFTSPEEHFWMVDNGGDDPIIGQSTRI